MTKVVSLLVALGIAACGGDTADPPDEPRENSQENCGRLEMVKNGACIPVEVTGTTELPIVIERDGWRADGVLTLPVADGPDEAYQAPVVVLIHGSGPHSRHGGVSSALGVDFGTTVDVYRSFADQMAARGVATLRYDKRTCLAEVVPDCANRLADYPGDVNAIMVDDFVEDARAAIRLAAAHPAIAENDVIVAGHSQGGSFVPHLVATEPSVSAGIGLAAAGLPLLDTLAGQLRANADHLASLNPTTFASDIDQLHALADRYETELAQVLAGTWPEPSWLGSSQAAWQNFAAWTDRPTTDLAGVADRGAPLLYVSGDLDFNIWPAHLERYRTLAASTAGLDLTTELFPGVTHAFVPVVAGVPPVGHEVDPRFSPVVIDRIVGWLRTHEG